VTDIPTTGAARPAPEPAAPSLAPSGAASSRDCPACGAANPADSTFCEACGADLVVAARASNVAEPPVDVSDGPVLASATPQTAPAGEESPLDVGWTGAVPSAAVTPVVDDTTCHACDEGHIVDGYCDHCGTPPPNPRDHVVASPASWVGGVCDIGKRHARNEDALALSAREPAGSRAVLVVCDGVSMATDSHIASLAAATAARAVLDQPAPATR
jgi:hypothetical protein